MIGTGADVMKRLVYPVRFLVARQFEFRQQNARPRQIHDEFAATLPSLEHRASGLPLLEANRTRTRDQERVIAW